MSESARETLLWGRRKSLQKNRSAMSSPRGTRRRIRLSRVIAYALLPGLALSMAAAAAFVKWQDGSARDAASARAESVQAASQGAIALLSYRPDTVQTRSRGGAGAD